MTEEYFWIQMGSRKYISLEDFMLNFPMKDMQILDNDNNPVNVNAYELFWEEIIKPKLQKEFDDTKAMYDAWNEACLTEENRKKSKEKLD